MIYPPDLKNGNFLQTEKSLSRAIGVYPFNLRQIKLIYAIIDKTYGWGKSKDDISVSQLSEMTGIQENHCSSTIKSLVAINVITKEKGKYAYKIGINKFFRDWQDWDTEWEWWNKDGEPDEQENQKSTVNTTIELTEEQISCWEWAKTDDFWQDKVPTQAAFLKQYKSSKQTLKIQYDAFLNKPQETRRMSRIEEKNNRSKTIKRKSFLNMRQNNEKIIEGEVVND